jgi:hypothetical protein
MIHGLARRRLSAYLDGSESARARARVERHLASCERCRGELAELRGTVALLRSLAVDDDPPAGFADRVLERVSGRDAVPSYVERLRGFLAQPLSRSWAPALASVTLLVVAAALLRVEVDVSLPFSGQGERTSIAAARAPFRSAPAPATDLGPLAPVSRSAPLATRRRFDPIALWHASGLRRACLASPNDALCHRYHQEMVSLALEDTPAFIDEVASVPSAPREHLLRVLSSEAVRSGSAARIVSQLRSVRDPRAVGIVVRFERSVPSRD